MTFFNILSAVLFVGAFKELLLALATPERFVLAPVVLCLLIFNDALFTSWAAEKELIDYKPSLMLIDLGNFLLVTLALLALNKEPTNSFGVPFPGLSSDWYWPALAGFWFLSIWWSRCSNLYHKAGFKPWLVKSAWVLLAVLALQAVVALVAQSLVRPLTYFTVVAVLSYMVAQYLHLVRNDHAVTP